MAVGVLYWAAWRILPGYFGYELVPRKETLEDGTVVTLVRVLPVCYLVSGDQVLMDRFAHSSRTKRLLRHQAQRLSEMTPIMTLFREGARYLDVIIMRYTSYA